jgi:predicted lipoprotein with Yx(FWY)xxD motif
MLATAVLAAALVALAGTPASAASRSAVAVRDTRYGKILVDGNGLALYLFTADGRGASRCYGACAKAWPPLLTKDRPRALRGAQKGLLGSVRRRDGARQVTYAGKPLYHWFGDRRPGDVGCHDVFEFGGTWLVLRASGKPVS